MALRLLVVDDSSVMRAMVRKALDLGGLPIEEILEAGDGREALDIVRRRPVDLAIIDVHMPVMGGPEFLRSVRASPELRSLRVLLLTSEGHTARTEEMGALGLSGYLRKPCTPEAIVNAAERALSEREQQDPTERIHRAIHGILETMAYIVCEPADREDAVRSAPSEAVWMTIGLPGSGTVDSLLPPGLAREVACNILGTDRLGERPDETAKDAVRELGSVIRGHLGITLAGEPGGAGASAPTLGSADADAWRRVAGDPATRAFRAGSHVGLVRARIGDPTPLTTGGRPRS